MKTSSASDRPAILGGRPVRPYGPPVWPRPDKAVQQALNDVYATGDWGRYHGDRCRELSRLLAEYHSVEAALLCSSGTAAVELALRGVGITNGDEVILAGYDFKANFQNVLILGAIPVLIDVCPMTGQLDTAHLEQALSDRTRAVLVSHLHGGVVDVRRVREQLAARDIAIVEDACQNPGALLWGRRAGASGDVGTLSFGGSKLLTAGRGGAILTSRTDVAERIKRHVQRGNEAYPLSELQAAVLIPQLAQLDADNRRRRATVLRLCERLSQLGGLHPLQAPLAEDIAQEDTAAVVPSYYKLGLRFDPTSFSQMTRDQFIAAMRAEGIALDVGFRGLHLIHASRRYRAVGSLEQATLADSRMIVLHHPVLLEEPSSSSDDDPVEQIASAIRRIQSYSSEIIALGSGSCFGG